MGVNTISAQTIISEIVKNDPEAAKNPMRFVRRAVSNFAVQQMNRSISQCAKCKDCKAKMFGVGNPHADLLIMIDTPDEYVVTRNGVTDVFAIFPEVKESLERTFKACNVDFNNVFIMPSIAGCLTRSDQRGVVSRAPTTTELKECIIYSQYIVDVIHPSMMLLMGNIAYNIFEKAPISKARGKWIKPYCIPAMPTYSPFDLADIKGNIDETKRHKMINDFQSDVINTFKAFEHLWPDNNLIKK